MLLVQDVQPTHNMTVNAVTGRDSQMAALFVPLIVRPQACLVVLMNRILAWRVMCARNRLPVTIARNKTRQLPETPFLVFGKLMPTVTVIVDRTAPRVLNFAVTARTHARLNSVHPNGRVLLVLTSPLVGTLNATGRHYLTANQSVLTNVWLVLAVRVNLLPAEMYVT